MAELTGLLENAGSSGEESGSLVGLAHRGWINLKSALATREDEAVLEECERGEDSAVKQYRQALETNHLGASLAIVQTQYDHIVKAQNLVKDLRKKISADTADI